VRTNATMSSINSEYQVQLKLHEKRKFPVLSTIRVLGNKEGRLAWICKFHICNKLFNITLLLEDKDYNYIIKKKKTGSAKDGFSF